MPLGSPPKTLQSPSGTRQGGQQPGWGPGPSEGMLEKEVADPGTQWTRCLALMEDNTKSEKFHFDLLKVPTEMGECLFLQ